MKYPKIMTEERRIIKEFLKPTKNKVLLSIILFCVLPFVGLTGSITPFTGFIFTSLLIADILAGRPIGGIADFIIRLLAILFSISYLLSCLLIEKGKTSEIWRLIIKALLIGGSIIVILLLLALFYYGLGNFHG